MTVKELIELLGTFPQDLPVGACNGLTDSVIENVSIRDVEGHTSDFWDIEDYSDDEELNNQVTETWQVVFLF